jgi:hypothetical protein
MGGKGTRTVLDLYPAVFDSAHLTFCTLAAITDQMPAFVSSYLLSIDFLVADPAHEISFQLFAFDIPQLL